MNEFYNGISVSPEWTIHRVQFMCTQDILPSGSAKCFCDKDLYDVLITKNNIKVSSYISGEYEMWEECPDIDTSKVELKDFTEWMKNRYGKMPDYIKGLFNLKNGKDAIQDSWG